jgi:hypothetical protein
LISIVGEFGTGLGQVWALASCFCEFLTGLGQVWALASCFCEFLTGLGRVWALISIVGEFGTGLAEDWALASCFCEFLTGLGQVWALVSIVGEFRTGLGEDWALASCLHNKRRRLQNTIRREMTATTKTENINKMMSHQVARLIHLNKQLSSFKAAVLLHRVSVSLPFQRVRQRDRGLGWARFGHWYRLFVTFELVFHFSG